MKKDKQKLNLTHYLSKYKFGIFLYILVYLIAGACTILQTLASASVIEKITASFYQESIYFMAFIVGLVVIKRICWYLSGLIYQKYANKIMADLNLDLAKQAFKLDSKTYSDHNTGTFVQRIVNDPENVVNHLADLVDIVTDIITSLVIIIYISTLNVYIGLIILGIIIICSLLEVKRNKLRRRNRRVSRKKNDKIHSLTTEIVRSEKDIKALGLENKLSEVSKESYQEYKKASYKTEVTDMSFWSLRNFIIEVGGFLMLILGIYMIDRGIITLATFMIIYSYNGNLYNLIWGIGNIANIFVEVKVSTERMFSLFDNKEFVCEKFGDTHLDNVHGDIEFKNVKYSYIEYEDESEDSNSLKTKKKDKNRERKIASVNTVFDNLSFKIKPNTTVAFVGRSGSGKSTILNLMSKMYEVDDGEILIDNVNINNLDKETLRNSISLVNQFPYIFDMTIKENLLLAKQDATDDEINEAITKASLKEFIDTLHKGLDSRIGESGIKLSGGQKQRLAIARALLRNSSIIIFDESTSSLDNFAQEEIKHSIDALKGKSTIIIVAHRLSTIQNVDQIFFLDEGKIVDVGTFEYLFENNIKFKNMFFAENLNKND